MFYPIIARVLKLLISLIFLLLLVVPMGYSYTLLDWTDMGSEIGWVSSYFYSEDLFLWIITGLLILWMIDLFNRHKKIKIVMRFFLLILSAFASFVAFLSACMPIQDYSVSWGTLLLFLFFPFLIVFFLVEWRLSRKMQKSAFYSEIVLDEENI